jgi:hypothetical protein
MPSSAMRIRTLPARLDIREWSSSTQCRPPCLGYRRKDHPLSSGIQGLTAEARGTGRPAPSGWTAGSVASKSSSIASSATACESKLWPGRSYLHPRVAEATRPEWSDRPGDSPHNFGHFARRRPAYSLQSTPLNAVWLAAMRSGVRSPLDPLPQVRGSATLVEQLQRGSNGWILRAGLRHVAILA